jgi:hypothetical protein
MVRGVVWIGLCNRGVKRRVDSRSVERGSEEPSVSVGGPADFFYRPATLVRSSGAGVGYLSTPTVHE